MEIVITSLHSHTWQQFAPIQLYLLLGHGDLFIQNTIFGTGTDIGNLCLPLLLHFRKFIRDINPRCQRPTDIMAKIHAGKTERIIRLAQCQLTLVKFHLYLQHIILRFHAMLMGTLHIPKQLIEQHMIFLRHFLHFFGFHQLHISLVCIQNHFGCSQFLIQMCHFLAEQ